MRGTISKCLILQTWLKLPMQLQPTFRNHADLLQMEVFSLSFLWLNNVWTQFMGLEIMTIFRNNHFIALPEYSCEILVCWWQRRQAVAVKETLLHGRRITAVSCPEVNLFLMNLQLFGFPAPLSWARAVGVTWISYTDVCTDSWAVEGSAGQAGHFPVPKLREKPTFVLPDNPIWC